jgi:hypothetical protein
MNANKQLKWKLVMQRLVLNKVTKDEVAIVSELLGSVEKLYFIAK